jgi:hypothetical protein
MQPETAEEILERHSAVAEWNERTQIKLLCRYINENGMRTDFDLYLADLVKDELDLEPDEEE